MEYDLRPQKRKMKHKGKNVVWSVAMDKCLIKALATQVRNGNKVDKCFNETAYSAACHAVNVQFNLSLNNQKVINRLKTIKKRYRIIKDMLSQRGFRWNPHRKMIECDDDDLWGRYVTAHPDAKGFCTKPIEMLDELKVVCGNYPSQPHHLSGRSGNPPTEFTHPAADDDSASFASQSSDELTIGDTDGTETEPSTGRPDYYNNNGDTQGAGGVPPPGHHPMRQQHAQQSWNSAEEALQDALLAVATSIRHLADSLERSKNPVDASELLEAVMDIENLDEGRKMYAFEYLNGDSIKARAFMAYNPRMRRMYLFKQFWWWR